MNQAARSSLKGGDSSEPLAELEALLMEQRVALELGDLATLDRVTAELRELLSAPQLRAKIAQQSNAQVRQALASLRTNAQLAGRAHTSAARARSVLLPKADVYDIDGALNGRPSAGRFAAA